MKIKLKDIFKLNRVAKEFVDPLTITAYMPVPTQAPA